MRQITRELHRPPPKTYTVKELSQLVHSDLCYCTYLMSGYLDALNLDIEMEDQFLPRVLQMGDHLERAHCKRKELEQHYRKRLGM